MIETFPGRGCWRTVLKSCTRVCACEWDARASLLQQHYDTESEQESQERARYLRLHPTSAFDQDGVDYNTMFVQVGESQAADPMEFEIVQVPGLLATTHIEPAPADIHMN